MDFLGGIIGGFVLLVLFMLAIMFVFQNPLVVGGLIVIGIIGGVMLMKVNDE